MNPDLDRQPRQNQRPHLLDDDITTARKIAMMYRARLGALDRAARDECDQVAIEFGQDWMVDRPRIIDEYADVTTSEAAELVRVHPDTIRKWACLAHPEQPDQQLLPRLGRRGRERTYLAQHVLAAAVAMRRAQLERTRT